MQFKVGRILVTIEQIQESTRARRKLARKVDQLVRVNGLGSTSLLIQRVKVYQNLVDPRPGLKEAKEWVEEAFADKGQGTVR